MFLAKFSIRRTSLRPTLDEPNFEPKRFAERIFGLRLFVSRPTLSPAGRKVDEDLSENRTGSVCKTSLMTSRALFFFERTACWLFRGRRLSNLLRWTRRRRVKAFGSAWLPLRPRLKPKEKSLACLSMPDSFVRFIVLCRTLQEWHTARWAIEEDEKCWYHRERTFLKFFCTPTSVEVLATPTARFSCTRYVDSPKKKLSFVWAAETLCDDKTRRARKANKKKKKTKLVERRGFVRTFEPMWATRLCARSHQENYLLSRCEANGYAYATISL